MKLHLRSFLSGAFVSALVFGTAVSALAISGRVTIEVDPINIQVNGEIFAPTDVNGKEVPVFAYQGTTYAPLRALAEAYGLEVGYNAEKSMATVTDPNASTTPDTTANISDYSDWGAEKEAAYQEFKAMWTFIGSQASSLGNDVMAYKFECNTINNSELEQIRDEKRDYVDRMLIEYAKQAGANCGYTVVGNFINNTRGFFSTVEIP